jgi:hypothetical protein
MLEIEWEGSNGTRVALGEEGDRTLRSTKDISKDETEVGRYAGCLK